MMLYNTMGMSHLKVEHIPVVTHNETSGLRTVFLKCHTIRSATLSVATFKDTVLGSHATNFRKL
jgi:hypothetical protein